MWSRTRRKGPCEIQVSYRLKGPIRDWPAHKCHIPLWCMGKFRTEEGSFLNKQGQKTGRGLKELRRPEHKALWLLQFLARSSQALLSSANPAESSSIWERSSKWEMLGNCKNTDFGDRFTSRFQLYLSPWANGLTSLRLHFLICKMQIATAPTSRTIVEMTGDVGWCLQRRPYGRVAKIMAQDPAVWVLIPARLFPSHVV